jgi:hypothetical protein
MPRFEYASCRDGEFFLGYLNKYPDYRTQAYSLDELVKNLASLLDDLKADSYENNRSNETSRQ